MYPAPPQTSRAPRTVRRRLPVLRRVSAWLVAVSMAATGIAACASSTPTGPRFTPAPPPLAGESLLYIDRVDRVSGVGAMRVRLDGGDVFELRDGEYAPVRLRTGGRRLELMLPLLGRISRGWNSVPFTAEGGGTRFMRVWAGVDEVQRGPEGRPDDFGAPGRGDRYASVNVFASIWSSRESDVEIRDLQQAPGVPRARQ
jgi:hypothetical protein